MSGTSRLEESGPSPSQLKGHADVIVLAPPFTAQGLQGVLCDCDVLKRTGWGLSSVLDQSQGSCGKSLWLVWGEHVAMVISSAAWVGCQSLAAFEGPVCDGGWSLSVWR